MNELPEKIVRYDTLRVEYGKKKMCTCHQPHYEVDFQNKLVYCTDCGAIVDPFTAMCTIARDTKRWDDYVAQRLEEIRQIDSYKPRRVVLKELEKKYIQGDNRGLEPTCPHCGQAFPLKALVTGRWCRAEFAGEGTT